VPSCVNNQTWLSTITQKFVSAPVTNLLHVTSAFCRQVAAQILQPHTQKCAPHQLSEGRERNAGLEVLDSCGRPPLFVFFKPKLGPPNSVFCIDFQLSQWDVDQLHRKIQNVQWFPIFCSGRDTLCNSIFFTPHTKADDWNVTTVLEMSSLEESYGRFNNFAAHRLGSTGQRLRVQRHKWLRPNYEMRLWPVSSIDTLGNETPLARRATRGGISPPPKFTKHCTAILTFAETFKEWRRNFIF